MAADVDGWPPSGDEAQGRGLTAQGEQPPEHLRLCVGGGAISVSHRGACDSSKGKGLEDGATIEASNRFAWPLMHVPLSRPLLRETEALAVSLQQHNTPTLPRCAAAARGCPRELPRHPSESAAQGIARIPHLSPPGRNNSSSEVAARRFLSICHVLCRRSNNMRPLSNDLPGRVFIGNDFDDFSLPHRRCLRQDRGPLSAASAAAAHESSVSARAGDAAASKTVARDERSRCARGTGASCILSPALADACEA